MENSFELTEEKVTPHCDNCGSQFSKKDRIYVNKLGYAFCTDCRMQYEENFVEILDKEV